MKGVLSIALISFLFFINCSDNIGPPGPQGPQGPEGAPGEIGYIFEYENIDFTGPKYEAFLPFPEDFDVLYSDVAIVYLLWGTTEVNGELIDIWRPLPQQLITDLGVLQYNYDFTVIDVRLFLDAEFPLEQLGALDTDDWIARVVIVPGEFWNGRTEIPPYEELKEALGLPEFVIENQKVNRRK